MSHSHLMLLSFQSGTQLSPDILHWGEGCRLGNCRVHSWHEQRIEQLEVIGDHAMEICMQDGRSPRLEVY